MTNIRTKTASGIAAVAIAAAAVGFTALPANAAEGDEVAVEVVQENTEVQATEVVEEAAPVAVEVEAPAEPVAVEVVEEAPVAEAPVEVAAPVAEDVADEVGEDLVEIAAVEIVAAAPSVVPSNIPGELGSIFFPEDDRVDYQVVTDPSDPTMITVNAVAREGYVFLEGSVTSWVLDLREGQIPAENAVEISAGTDATEFVAGTALRFTVTGESIGAEQRNPAIIFPNGFTDFDCNLPFEVTASENDTLTATAVPTGDPQNALSCSATYIANEADVERGFVSFQFVFVSVGFNNADGNSRGVSAPVPVFAAPTEETPGEEVPGGEVPGEETPVTPPAEETPAPVEGGSTETAPEAVAAIAGGGSSNGGSTGGAVNTASNGSERLAQTGGSNGSGFAAAAAMLLTAGGALVLAARRRMGAVSAR